MALVIKICTDFTHNQYYWSKAGLTTNPAQAIQYADEKELQDDMDDSYLQSEWGNLLDYTPDTGDYNYGWSAVDYDSAVLDYNIETNMAIANAVNQCIENESVSWGQLAWATAHRDFILKHCQCMPRLCEYVDDTNE